MSKELDAWKYTRKNYLQLKKEKYSKCKDVDNILERCNKRCDLIEQALKQAKENEKMLNIFKNALTLETKQNVALPLDHSEDVLGYSIRTLTEIKQNELDNDLKKELREWVLKNAFPKELKVLEAIKEEFEISFNDKKQTIQFQSIEEPYTYIRFSLTREIKDKEKYNLLKEVLL